MYFVRVDQTLDNIMKESVCLCNNNGQSQYLNTRYLSIYTKVGNKDVHSLYTYLI